MKIVKNNIPFWLMAILLIMGSCNKSLNLTPIDDISDNNYWSTANDFKLWANGFYGGLRSTTSNFSPDIFDDANSDLCGGFDGTMTTPASSSLWDNSYSAIRTINILLQHAVSYTGNDNIKQYVAEAHFFRAYKYSDLYMTYGGVPLATKVYDVNSPELYGPRCSRDSIVDFIVKELNIAIPDLPLESAIADGDKGRISQGAAQSLLARVALFEGTWQKSRGNSTRAKTLLDLAISSSNSIIAGNQYKLWSPANGIALGDSSYFYLFSIENQQSNPGSYNKSSNHEFILSRKFDDPNAPNGDPYPLTGKGNPARPMMDIYLSADGLPINKSPLFAGYTSQQSEFVKRDQRLTRSVAIPYNSYYGYSNGRYPLPTPDGNARAFHPITQNGTLYGSRKFATERQLSDANHSGSDYPVIRYAEVLLINAEAKFESNGAINDADLNATINQLRDRVNMPHLTNMFVTSNGLDMRTEIRRERTVELVLEGFRLTDLYRWKTAEIEMPKAVLGVPVLPFTNPGAGSSINYPFDPTNLPATDPNGFYIYRQASLRKFDASKNYLMPIPSQQIQENPSLVQNPGW